LNLPLSYGKKKILNFGLGDSKGRHFLKDRDTGKYRIVKKKITFLKRIFYINEIYWLGY
jgi:hypothetical protein